MITLIKNVRLLTMTSEDDELPVGDILILNNRIVSLGKMEKDVDVDIVIEGKGMLAMPGLINAHTHLGMTLMRNYADDMNLQEWLEKKIWPLEDYLEAEDVYWGSLLNMMELIKTGTTSFIDMYFFMDEVGKAAERIGMRGILTRGLVAFTDKEGKNLAEAKALYGNWQHACNDRIRTMLAPHAPYTCPKPYMMKILKLAEDLSSPIHTHISETKKEVEDIFTETGKTPLMYLADLGLLEHHVVAAHCVHLTDEEIEMVKDKSFYPVYNPSSNLKLASGFAPVSKLLKQGTKMALATDGASSNNHTNMWEEIHLAALVNKAVDEDPTSVSAYDALTMATVNGAYAMGQKEELGTLEIGKKADIILIDIHKLHMQPHHNLISALAYSAQGSDVDTVLIDGRLILRHGEFVGIDENEVVEQVKKRTEELLKRAGVSHKGEQDE